MIKLLIVDDSALMRRVLGNVFKHQVDFDVAFARDGVEALTRLHDFQPDVVTLDVQMPVMGGLACLDRIMLERPTAVIMVSSLTAEGTEETLEAISLGAIDFIAKPSGAISLAMDEFAPHLIEKVRTAARARLPSAARLAERVRMKLGMSGPGTGKARSKHALPATPQSGPGHRGGVVLIGSSTGGPPALDAVLSRLPAEFPWPVLVAQHMPGTFTGPLSRRLDKLCALTVVEVMLSVPLAKGFVYVGKGDADIVVTSKAGVPCADVAISSPEFRWHPSVDRMVDTAMQLYDPRSVVGVLMTGMGDDGAAAMTRLRSQGGHTIAEAQETAVVWGMPGQLVKAGGAEVVLPVGRIADQLLHWAG